jgi:4a-hydroxytetrahydrobiopterin dehydratase
MGDGDDVVTEAEREQHLGGGGNQAYDAHGVNDMTTPPLLSGDEVAARLLGLDWRLEGDSIVRDLKFDDFQAAIAYMNRVAEVAETHNHHPDMLIHGWNKVKLSLTNHAAGGLTEIDFDMAARFDQLLGQTAA